MDMLGLIKLTQFNILTGLQNVVSNSFVSILVFALIGGIVISSIDFKKSYLSTIYKF